MSKTQVAPSECGAIVSENLCVQSDITIIPVVEMGTVEYFCIGNPMVGVCTGTPVDECTISVRQNVCIQIPLIFSVEACAEAEGIVCGTPVMGPCCVI